MNTYQLKRTSLAIIAFMLIAVASLQTVLAADNVTVTVLNISNKAVCSVYISPVTDSVWTGEQLGNSQMAHWAQRTFSVAPGTYDFRADFCDGSERTIAFDVAVNADFTWEIGGQAPAAPAEQPPAQSPEQPAPEQPQADTPPAQPTGQDNDGDGVDNAQDRCPTDAETPNGIDDDDGCPDSLDDLFSFYEVDIHEFWVRDSQLRGQNYNKPSVTYTWSATDAAFYDSRDHGIRMSRLFSLDMLADYGDHAVVTILSHEWGHAVQREYGLMDNVRFTYYLERQADCMAGAYSRDAEQRGLIDMSDIIEARALMDFVGDDLPWWDVRAHGSSEERVANYNSGYWGGVDACIN